MLPHNFKTQNELDEYIKCIRNLKVGDKVQFYYLPGDSVFNEMPVSYRTNYLFDAEVVCIYPQIVSPYKYRHAYPEDFPLIYLGSKFEAFASAVCFTEKYRKLLQANSRGYYRFKPISETILIAKIFKAPK